MFNAEAIEFPFVQDMPKREQSRWAKVWDQFQELSKLSEQKGMLVPQVFAAKLLGISPVRIHELATEGRLERVYAGGHPFITEESVLAYAKTERKAGRPLKIMGVDCSAGTKEPTKAEVWQASVRMAKELRGK